MRTLAKSRKRTRTVKLRTNGKHKIDAASTMNVPMGLGRVLRPQALFRWLGPQLAAITPTYIEQTMLGAMAGSSLQAWSLFDLMLKTWPELLACYQELIESVIRKKLVYEPYCEEDEKPTPSALEKQKVVATALRQMQPDATRDDSDLEGTIRDVLDAWFRGVAVSEIVWQNVDDKQVGTIMAPKSTFAVDPTNYGFDSDGSLGLRDQKAQASGTWPYSTTTLNPQPNQLKPFPDNKFLIAMHKASGGSPLGGALLRPLAWWWCAANFSSDWLLNLAQLFGLPFRWVTYDNAAGTDTLAAIDQMLQNMGSNGWARFPQGTTMEMLQTGKEGSDHSPQGELLDRADRYARSLILGQTMTGNHGTTGKGGGQAFGTVEESVKSDRIDAAGKFAVTIINQQLVPSILMLNFGDTDEMPTLKFLEDEVADLTEAQRDKTLADAGLEIGVDYLRKKYDIPEPADGEDVIGGEKPMPDFGQFSGGSFDQTGTNTGQGATDEPPSDLKSSNDLCRRLHGISQWRTQIEAEEAGHPFHGNQYTHLGSKPVHSMTAREINSELDKLEPHVREHLPQRFIESGRGSEKASETWKKSDPLAQEFKAYHKRIGQLRQEIHDRYGPDAPGRLPTHKRGAYPPRSGVSFVDENIHASDQTGHPFRGNQWTSGQSQGAALGMGMRNESMQTEKGRYSIHQLMGKKYAVNFVTKEGQTQHIGVFKNITDARSAASKHYASRQTVNPFPSLLPSEENKRRLMQNAGLQTKLLELNAIEDDAVFSRELEALACEEAGHPFRGNQWTTGEHGESIPIQNGTRVKFHSGEYKGATGTVRGVIARTNVGNRGEDVHHVDIEYPNGMKFNKTPISVSHIKEHSEKL